MDLPFLAEPEPAVWCFMSLSRVTVPAILAVCWLLGGSSTAKAGWLIIKNDTKHVILIQETGGPLNRPIRGKFIKLQPGETYREYHLLPGEKTVILSNAEQEDAPSTHERMTWQKDDMPFSVKPDGEMYKLVAAKKAK